MKRNNFKLNYLLTTFIIWIFIFSLCQVTQAARPGYKAKHHQQKGQTEINLDIILPDYTLTEETEWIVLNCNDEQALSFTQKGEPGLYSLRYFISIPEKAKVEEVILKPQIHSVELTKPIRPIPEAVPIGSPQKPPIPDERIYHFTFPYPEKDFDYEMAKQGSTRMLVLTLYPFKYVGATKTLLVTEYMDVKIILETKQWKPNPKPYNAVDKNLKYRLVNPDESFFSPRGAK